MALGVTKFEIMHSTPKVLKAYDKAHSLKRKMEDEQAWYIFGNYGISAFMFAIDHSLNGKKAKSEYIKEPILSKINENDGLTQEEIDERELKKMLLYEEQWQRQYKKKGLPETVIF